MQKQPNTIRKTTKTTVICLLTSDIDPIITLQFLRGTLRHSALIAPNVQKNISGVHRPLVLLGCGLLHKCLGRCLPTSLSPGKIGCSSAQSWRSHHADRRALIHTHLVCAHTHTTHTVLDLMQTGKCAARTEWTGSPSASELSSNQSKALSLMASQVGGWMGRWVGVVRGGNCAALAKVMYCLLWMEVQTRRSVMDV